MKTIITKSLSLMLAILFLLSLAACNSVNKEGLWEDADHLSDKTFGKGEKTVTVEVTAEEQTVTFTIHTDKETVGEALLEHDLIDGDQGPYGLYIKKVNGMTADFDADQTYWAFYENDAYATSGVDTTKINEEVVYRLVHTK